MESSTSNNHNVLRGSTQQGSSQENCRRRETRAPRRALAASILVCAGMGLGCGDVSFVPSPYTPQDVDLVYSAQEDITVVRWRIASTLPADPDLGFQILGATGFETIVFSQSVFPGGGTLCGDGTGSCFQYVVRGRYATFNGGRPIQAVHARLGSFSGGIAKVDSVPQTLAVASFFHSGNQLVTVNITDQVASQGPYVYPRSYNRGMWPTNGLCVSDTAPDGVSFSPLDPTTDGFPPESPLTDSGIYCVAVSPVPSDAGGATLAEARIATRPEVVTLHQTFVPPVVESPVIYQIVLDLEIPITDLCASSSQEIEMLVDKYMNYTGNDTVPVKKLPTVYLAGDDPNVPNGSANCAQTNALKLDASTLADQVMQEVTSHPEQFQQFHFFFFDNLNAPLLQPLVTSLSGFFSALGYPPAPYQLRTLSWLFNPGLGQANAPTPSWTMTPSWEDASDPSFEQLLSSYAMKSLPYESQYHDQTVPVALLSADDATTYDGDQIKICQSAPKVTPVDVTSGTEFFSPSWQVMASDPPGYLVSFPTQQQQAPFTSFVQVSATVDYQICSRYCDNHPYVSLAGTGENSWTASNSCAETND
jgi:hypothetical protein